MSVSRFLCQSQGWFFRLVGLACISVLARVRFPGEVRGRTMHCFRRVRRSVPKGLAEEANEVRSYGLPGMPAEGPKVRGKPAMAKSLRGNGLRYYVGFGKRGTWGQFSCCQLAPNKRELVWQIPHLSGNGDAQLVACLEGPSPRTFG